MAFIQLKEFRAVEVIEKKERIAFIAKCSMDAHLIFFKDSSYQLVDRLANTVLHEGKLDFLPLSHLPSSRAGRVVVLGRGSEGEMQCAVIDLERDCAVETREIENAMPESTTAYHLYEAVGQGGEEGEGG